MAVQELNLDEPHYVLLFFAPHSGESYPVVVGFEKYVKDYRNGRITLPLGIDTQLVAILPAILYTLQLPRTRFDTVRASIRGRKDSQALHLPHRLVFVPVPWSDVIPARLRNNEVKVVFAPDRLLADARTLAGQIDRVVDVVSVSDLNASLLGRHWRVLHEALRLEKPLYSPPARLIHVPTRAGSLLPALFSVRQLRPDWEGDAPDETASTERLLSHAFDTQAQLSAIARLEAARTPPGEAEKMYPETLEEEMGRFKCPVVVGVPGLSPGSPTRFVSRALEKAGLLRSTDGGVEHDVLEILVAHRALSHSWIGFTTRAVSDVAFERLHSLERSWGPWRPRPRPIWRLLDQIAEELASHFTEIERATVSHADPLICFSEFPIGLARFPDDTSPLIARVPVIYRPIMPLSRALFLEGTGVPTVHLRGRLNVLVAECIDASDVVGRLSRAGWRVGAEMLGSIPSASIEIAEIRSLADLKRRLRGARFDALVLSAHGGVEQGRAGVVIGEELIVEQDLGDLPPIVCLSACQVSPRGAGTVNVSDLMFRHGAAAVIGTLVPIDVRRNATLLARFFVYVAEALSGSGRLRTLAELWHFVQMSNAINDVVSGNARIRAWAHAGRPDDSVLHEFMMERSPGRIRGGHLYRDTEMVLGEIADERGIGEQYRSWLRSQGYIPESLFYVMLGWPDRFVFFNQKWAKWEDTSVRRTMPPGPSTDEPAE